MEGKLYVRLLTGRIVGNIAFGCFDLNVDSINLVCTLFV